MNKLPSVSVIISIYNDLEALELVIEALLSQSYLPNEIIITEDAEHEHIKKYILNLDNKIITHLTHKDAGWRKEVALNNAIKVSKYEYLIFIDGDCVPYTDFIKSHLKLSAPDTALCGRRTEPGSSFSTKLRNREISIKNFQKNYLVNFFSLKKDKIRHYDEGLYFKYNSVIFTLIHKFGRKNSHIVGCNWSCYKNNLELINGYDEDFILPTTGEDTDIERRLKHFGIEMKSCRNAANVIHLYHKKIFNPEISKKTKSLMNTKKDIYICKNGLNK